MKTLAYSRNVDDSLKKMGNQILWISAGVSLAFLAVENLNASESLYFIAIVIAVGSFAFFKKPFFSSGFLISIDQGIAILASAIVLIYLGGLVVQPSLDQEQSLEPCAALTTEKKCYSLPKLVCQNMWEKYEGECIKEIKKDVGNRVTALIGPPIKKCTQRRFDKSLYYTRNSKDPNCQKFFQSLTE